MGSRGLVPWRGVGRSPTVSAVGKARGRSPAVFGRSGAKPHGRYRLTVMPDTSASIT